MKRFTIQVLFTLSAAISMALTLQYMFSLGTTVTTITTFLAAGILFEGCKLLFPMVATQSFKRQRYATGSLMIVLAGALAALSFTCSLMAFDNANRSALRDSEQTKQLTSIIATLEQQAAEQRRLSRITKAAQTEQQIIGYRNELRNTAPDSVSATIGKEVAIGVSLLIEILSLVLSAMVPAMSKRPTTQAAGQRLDVGPYDDSRGTFVLDTNNQEDEPLESNQKADKGVQVDGEIANHIIQNMGKFQGGKLKYRAIADSLGSPVSGAAIKEALLHLKGHGLVHKSGNSWVFSGTVSAA